MKAASIALAGLLAVSTGPSNDYNSTAGLAAKPAAQVEVVNLPLDADGNLRVSGQAVASAAVIEMTVRQDEMTPGAFGTGAVTLGIPPGFSRASVTMVRSLDWSKAFVNAYCVRFGPVAPPMYRDFAGTSRDLPLSDAVPEGEQWQGSCVSVNQAAISTYQVAGPRMEISIATGGSAPPDTEYYVHVFLSK